jgi:hypothetical protein
MDNLPWKYAIDFVVVITAVISIIISIKSCKISQKANDAAENAIEISRHQFIQKNRPYIVIEAEKYDDGQYWTLEQKGATVIAESNFKFMNVGNVAAVNIHFPDAAQVISRGPLKELKFIKTADNLSVGPNGSFHMKLKASLEKDSLEEATKELEFLKSDASNGYTHGISIIYENGIDLSQKYQTTICYRIHNDNAFLLKSEMINLSESQRGNGLTL